MNGLAKDTKFVSKIDWSNLKTLKKLSFSEIRQLKVVVILVLLKTEQKFRWYFSTIKKI